MSRAPDVLACSSCARSFVVSDGRGTLTVLTGGCPVCGTGRWGMLGPEWPNLVSRLRSLLGVCAGSTDPRARRS
jgi:hypothetical protein